MSQQPHLHPVEFPNERWPLVGERHLPYPRAPLPELAPDPNRERQSRWCQGFDADWFIPSLLAPKWRTLFYPLRPSRESVDQWLRWIDTQRTELLGPFALPDDAAKLERDQANDVELIRQCRPDLLAAPAAEQLETFLPSHLSAPDLARLHGLPKDNVESFLRRYRRNFPDCYIENESRRKNDPHYLYRTKDVMPALKAHVQGPTMTEG
jgi:hypothetical protein